MKCKEIQKQENVNLQLKNKKKQRLKEKGITLIALVVTIIILLILAGVTLNRALSEDGLFSKARNAAEKYKKAQEDEVELISEIGKEMNNEYVGAKVTGYEPKAVTINIGIETSGIGTEDSVDAEGNNIEKDEKGNQEFTTDIDMQWRIWDYDGTTLRIISEKPTKQRLALKGATGYNNGVWAINEICRKCYSSEEDGISVANLKRSDIEKISTYDYTRYKHKAGDWNEITDNTEGESIIHYGETKTYDTNFKSPIMWSKYDIKWSYEYDTETKKSIGDPSCGDIWEDEFGFMSEGGTGSTGKDTKFKQTYYAHDYKENGSEFINEKYYSLIFGDEKRTGLDAYWLAGRYANVTSTMCGFGINLVGEETGKNLVYGYSVYTSEGDIRIPSFSLRPIVSINLKNSGYDLIKDTDSKDEVRYKLVKKEV